MSAPWRRQRRRRHCQTPLGIREFDQLLPDLFGIGAHAECRMQCAAVDDGR